MAAVTVNWRCENCNIGEEVLYVTTAADGDTYLSRLSKVRAAVFSSNLGTEAAADVATVAFSGQTVTFQLANTTAVNGTLHLWGDC